MRALFAYPGDPPLSDSLDSGYDRTAEFGIFAVDLTMGSEYRQHVEECAKMVDRVNRKRIKALYGMPFVDPGDPPPFRIDRQERVIEAAYLARALDLKVLANGGIGQPGLEQPSGMGVMRHR